MFRNRRWRRAAVAGAAALLVVGVAACSSGSGSTSSAPSSSASPTLPAAPGGTARVALPAGVTLNWIWPYVPLSSENEYNTEGFEMLLYRPLYMFGDNGPSATVNYPLSVANAPAYSAGGRTVTITLKGWKWSDGETVDASDVIFWLNMMKAEPSSYYGYVPGLLPDNLASYRATGPDTVVLNLKSEVSNIWFTYNQLAEITPMPAAWDVTSVRAKPGSGGCATDTAADQWAKCIAVFHFLTAQARNAKTYAASPIWGVVDGPWKLSSFSTATSGAVTSFVPNTAYSGSPRPDLSKFTYYAYAGDASEYQALRAGKLDVGYIPPQDLAPVSGGEALPPTDPLGSGYTMSATYSFGVQYLMINFNNPTIGPAFRQLYVRQAIQELVDQEGMINAVDRGYGYPTSGAVPAKPSNQWVPAVEESNGGQGPYPFSISGATSLLTLHGWSEVGGVMTCEDPGKCGPGITKGTQLKLTMDYATGVQVFQQEVALLKSDAAQAGIQINVVPQSFNTISGEAKPCASGPECSWDILNSGGWSYSGPGFEPTGESLFATGASSNPGGYSDPVEDQLINLTHTSNSLSVFQQYATYTAEQLPFIWTPSSYSVSVVSSKLGNVGNSPLGTLLPEYWYFTK
jgi:peptide/nickel transport system substrate-binding protein